LKLSAAVWTLDDLVERVGLKDKHSSTKALSVWVELGVLREDKEQCQYTLLEVAEAGSVGKRKVDPQRTGVTPEESEPVASAQQQQAEQMKMYWKVRAVVFIDFTCGLICLESLLRVCFVTSEVFH
jgi:anaphase-promoting complex subunit 2